MADLREILPSFDLQPWRHLTFSLEKKNVYTAELISQDSIEIARKCPLPPREVKRFATAVISALQQDVLGATVVCHPSSRRRDQEPPRKKSRLDHTESVEREVRFVKTLDANIDHCLGGGFPTGNVCEIVGESAVGKTQFVLNLLLTAQLPMPKGLGRAVMYLSTEDKLNTSRLHQILTSNPEYQDIPDKTRPSLNRVFTMSTHNFDHQENIILYKLPFLVESNNIGLLVIDSIAANFRTQFAGAAPAVLTRRALALARLGNVLRQIANKFDVAVVVTNQVGDRFDDARIDPNKFRSPSATPTSSATNMPASQAKRTQISMGPPPPRRTLRMSRVEKTEVMRLDYQQCFFTGWGEEYDKLFESLKTPTLGLSWANQISARIVLKIGQERTTTNTQNSQSDSKRRRYMSVVFAPWVPPTNTPVEYELCMQGPVSIPLPDGNTYAQANSLEDELESETAREEDDDLEELLDPKYWEDDIELD